MESDSLVFGAAGNGAWFAYLISMLGLWLVGVNINQFAKRCASSGSLYAYIGRGLGTEWGLFGAWCLVLAYLCTAMATLLGAGIYSAQVLRSLGLSVSLPLLLGLMAAIGWWTVWKDVQLSVRWMLWIEASSVLCLSLIAALLLAKEHAWLDWEQLSLQKVDLQGLRFGMIMAIFSYVGYESAACLGEESRKPFRAIPEAILWSVLLSGFFFTWIAYAKLAGLRALGQSWRCGEITVADLAQAAGLGMVRPVLQVLAILSFFACSVASITAASRVLLLLGRQEILPGVLAQIHPANRTPHVAATFCCGMSCVFPMALLSGMQVDDAYDFLGTVATYGFLVTYGLVALAAPIYLFRLQELRVHNLLASVGSLAFLSLPLGASHFVARTPAIGQAPYVFGAYLACGLAWIGLLRLSGNARFRTLDQSLVWELSGPPPEENV